MVHMFAALPALQEWLFVVTGPLGWLLWVGIGNAPVESGLIAQWLLTMATAVAVALAMDWRWGEPRAAWHPVVWMGQGLHRLGGWIAPTYAKSAQWHVRGLGGADVHPAPTTSAPAPEMVAVRSRWGCWGDVAWGALAWLVQAVAWALLFAGMGALVLLMLPWWAAALVLGVLLKPLLAWAMLHAQVLAVEQALGHSLQAGRERLAWLVSRDTAALPAPAVREAAIESLAENLSDSLIAALLWFGLLGLGGAALYRFANTADAMWGYMGWRRALCLRSDESPRWQYWQWVGKFAARADDALNYLSARITAVLLWLAWSASRGSAGSSAHSTSIMGARAFWSQLRHQAALTPSPNGGWPMGAMALLLGVRLGKPGAYVLHAEGAPPCCGDVYRALRIATGAARLGAWATIGALLCAAIWVLGAGCGWGWVCVSVL